MRTRRSFLEVVIGLAGAAIALLVGVPGVAVVLDPLLRGRGQRKPWVRVAELDALAANRPTSAPVVGERVDAWTRFAQVRLGTVWLRKDGKRVLALTAECPHLGCKIGYDTENRQFACPCHHSTFGLDGTRKGGPTPRSMDPLEARVVNGQVEVRFVRFRAQVKQRVELG